MPFSVTLTVTPLLITEKVYPVEPLAEPLAVIPEQGLRVLGSSEAVVLA